MDIRRRSNGWCGRWVLALAACGVLVSPGRLLHAADENAPEPKKPNWAATSLAEVDDDFPLQGEYWGWVTYPGMPRHYAGLQVIAQGAGKFDAVLLTGGLPGWGWNRVDRVKLSGDKDENGLTLVGVGLNALVTPETATLTGSDDAELGVLRKTVRHSPTENQRCPAHGKELFTTNTTDGFKKPRTTPDGLLQVGTETAEPIDDFYLHLEFQLPYMPYARGQGRANSGVYITSRYEVQILDSYGLEGKNNECGALYTYKAPDQNMCFPPLAWQTYDIEFRSPEFDKEGKKTANGELTVWHNGVKVQDHFAFERKTGAGQPEGPNPLPTKLQDHGNPVRFRNIWYVSLPEPTPAGSAPPAGSPPLIAAGSSPAPCAVPGRYGAPAVVGSYPIAPAYPAYTSGVPVFVSGPLPYVQSPVAYWGVHPSPYQPEPLYYQFRSAFNPFGW